MINESFYSKIMNLINNKTEGQYWDFKREPYKDNEYLEFRNSLSEARKINEHGEFVFFA